MSAKNLQLIDADLQHWVQDNKRVRLFLRDDDAVKITAQLRRLAELCDAYNIPILLAVIPNEATLELADFVRASAKITPAVHGISHTNHGGGNEKKIELGGQRSARAVIDELKTSREKMLQMFGNELSTMLVPPWNRISQGVAAKVEEAGFGAISGFGWKAPIGNLPWINTHVDIIDWKNGKKTKSFDCVMAELSENLTIARENNYAPIGILTHHLVHNDATWSMLEALFELIGARQHIDWLNSSELITLSGSE